MDDLIAFLRARWHESGERASFLRTMAAALPPDTGRYLIDVADEIDRDLEAKRRIIRAHNVWAEVYPEDANMPGLDRHCVGCGFNGVEEYAVSDINDCPTLRALALPYADHPEYREEWRP